MGKKAPATCMEEHCPFPKHLTFRRCYWHWLPLQPIETQERYAEHRLSLSAGHPPRARVAEVDWPDGYRWCAGCQSFIPKFYARGSRCVACASRASHRSHIKSAYDLTDEEYRALLAWQAGRCYICDRVPRSRRLAVDHDHVTGEVRGLLCADDERGCNHALLGNISGIDMARRIIDYLEAPPYARLRAGAAPPPRLPRPTRRERIAHLFPGGPTNEATAQAIGGSAGQD